MSIEKFTMVEMHRKDLKKYPHNPRKISAESKRRLKAGLEKHGLVQPLIFNKRTGYLVGGHQRLACLDDIQETKDYTLNIAVIDVDETKEKELVVFLNNTSSMGFWDDAGLMALMQSEDIDVNALGFSTTEIDYFNKLMNDASSEESAAIEYMNQISEETGLLTAAGEEKSEEIKNDKESKKMKWERMISGYFEPAPEATGANAKSEDELTPEEKEHRANFRNSRENWKKQEGSTEVVVRIVFLNEFNAKKWLGSKGMPIDNFLLHEKEL